MAWPPPAAAARQPAHALMSHAPPRAHVTRSPPSCPAALPPRGAGMRRCAPRGPRCAGHRAAAPRLLRQAPRLGALSCCCWLLLVLPLAAVACTCYCCSVINLAHSWVRAADGVRALKPACPADAPHQITPKQRAAVAPPAAALQALPLYKFKAGVRHQYISVCLPGRCKRSIPRHAECCWQMACWCGQSARSCFTPLTCCCPPTASTFHTYRRRRLLHWPRANSRTAAASSLPAVPPTHLPNCSTPCRRRRLHGPGHLYRGPQL